jgi:hypothetical protein
MKSEFRINLFRFTLDLIDFLIHEIRKLQMTEKQIVLKPQDLVVVVKLAVNRNREFTLSELASELHMAVSVVHGSIGRSELARLISRSSGGIRVIRSAVHEFVIHGAKYAFPGILGPLSKGVPTAVAGPILRTCFEQADTLPPVWPDPEGSGYGPGLTPLSPIVPKACKKDLLLLDALTLVDALRIGAAREQELAVSHLMELLA